MAHTTRWKAAKHSWLANQTNKRSWASFKQQTKQVNINRNGKKKKISGEVSSREGA